MAAAADAAAAAESQLPPPELSAAITGQYGIHIDLNSEDSGLRLCDCFDLLFEPKCAVSRLQSGGILDSRKMEIPEFVTLLKKPLPKKPIVSIQSLVLMNAHSTLIPVEIPCVQSLLSADSLLSVKAAIAARGAAGPPSYGLRSESRANWDTAHASMMATRPREVCLDLHASRRLSRFNLVYVLRNLLRLNITNDFSLQNDYEYLTELRLDEDPYFAKLFSRLNDTTKTSRENNAEMLKYQMEQVDLQGGVITEELKNTIKESLNTFTPIWPDSIRDEDAGSTDTFKHRIVVITNGVNDDYELTPQWNPEAEESKIMQRLAFGISFKAVLIIQTSPTERVCMDFVLNLNKKKLFNLFSVLFIGRTCVPYLQCWFYLDDLISIILESPGFKNRIYAAFDEYINKDVQLDKTVKKNLLSFIGLAYDNPSSSLTVVDSGCNHPFGYLSPPGHGPSHWTWNDTDFKIISGLREVRGGGVMVDLVNSTFGGGISLSHCTFPESMSAAFNDTTYPDSSRYLHEGSFFFSSQEAVDGSQPDLSSRQGDMAEAPPAESRAKRIVANILKTVHTIKNFVLCRIGFGSGATAGGGGHHSRSQTKRQRRHRLRPVTCKRSRKSRKGLQSRKGVRSRRVRTLYH